MRYAVECDTPDNGHSVYAECFGLNGMRGIVLSEHNSLEAAIEACDGNPATDSRACRPWIFDRRTGKIVSASRIKKLQATED